eukprot:CAMPEP_0202854778 /NCGR_PEP_ID=MMETSP1389-20130828/91177_1 /ASSEMBLY_ACC=CAM_ASM_000865 /TAXON_ID=302021 /ORGANISM="Rhodomonas sp., Strain CCMP768" /LENGTH=140 /DNA_ID=CAMNT_0049533377 /DNA_START=437 /DNA_END=859 /DNA_ORIENTATION=+
MVIAGEPHGHRLCHLVWPAEEESVEVVPVVVVRLPPFRVEGAKSVPVLCLRVHHAWPGGALRDGDPHLVPPVARVRLVRRALGDAHRVAHSEEDDRGGGGHHSHRIRKKHHFQGESVCGNVGAEVHLVERSVVFHRKRVL